LVQHQGQSIYIYPQLLQINTDGFALDTQTIALQQIQHLKSQILKEFRDLQIYESGMIFFAADSAQSAQADISLISLGSTIGVILLMLLVFRSLKAFLLPIISIGLGVLFAFLLCQTLFGGVHILTLVFGASLIGVVVDYSLHYFYFCVHQQHINNQQTLLTAKSAFYRALSLSLLSSVVGYAALAVSGLEALTQIAIFSAVGLIFSWLFVVVCGHYLTRSVKVYDAVLNQWIAKVISALQPVANGRILFPLLSVLILGLVASFSGMQVSDSPKALINTNQDLVDREQLINSWVSGYEPASFVVVSGESEQQVFDRIDNLRNQLSKQKGIFPDATDLLAVDQFLPSPQAQQQNHQLNQWLYDSNNLFAANFIKQQGLDELVNLQDLRAQLGKQSAASPKDLFVSNKSMPSLWVESSLDKKILSFMLIPKHTQIAELQKTLQGLDGVVYFSAVDETREGLQHLRESALQYLLLALSFIGLLLLYQYRFKKSLYLIAIPVMSLCGSLVLLILFNIPLSLFHVMALFLVLGLGIDYVVFVAEMTSANLENANDGDFFPAIVLSSITNLLSFGLLALSSMPAVNAFGITLLFGCTLNLLGAIWLVAIWRKTFLVSVNQSH
jgi:predicted exporter